MRLYTFLNYYLSSIQQGIQSAHLTHELFNKYGMGEVGTCDQFLQLHDWSKNHKTMVVLNGGNCATLEELRQFLNTHDNQFPHGFFCEDSQSLNNALTCVGIVLPARIYETAAALRTNPRNIQWSSVNEKFDLRIFSAQTSRNLAAEYKDYGSFTAWERELLERLNTYGLAK